jgi:transposase
MCHATRDIQKEATWRRRLRDQAKSGQSVRAWCRQHDVTETGFYWWRRELARRDTEDSAALFVPVHVAEALAEDGAASMEIVLTDGRRVRLTGPVDGQALAEVLEVLERRSC